jgi:hypothetical protein
MSAPVSGTSISSTAARAPLHQWPRAAFAVPAQLALSKPCRTAESR